MTQRADYIIPECYIDTNLVETLICIGGCNHQKGCNQVAKVIILSCAKAARINMTDYELSPLLKEFTSQTKNVMSNKDIRFKRLFNSMKNIGEMKLFDSILAYLVSTTYSASNDDLLNIFKFTIK